MRESSALLSLIGHATRLVKRLTPIPTLYRMAGTARLHPNLRGLPGVPSGGCPRTEAHACPCRHLPLSPPCLATVVLATVVLATVVLATVVLVAGAACAHLGHRNDY